MKRLAFIPSLPCHVRQNGWMLSRETGMTTIARQFDGLRPEAIRKAYARLARYYDFFFGPLLAPARTATIHAINALPGRDILEVGVGTGLALPKYAPEKRVTGIDVSADMLSKAKDRCSRLRLSNIREIREMDAQATSFADGEFDIAVAMFVASVVPDPRALLAEMRRIVKPGGVVLFVNHFAQEGHAGRWRKTVDMLTGRLGWRADFRLQDMFDDADLRIISRRRLFPMGLFQLVALQPNAGSKPDGIS
jgi:phosphatidylethanolamine/phosphatidyl-N-methylethanolamine N-methyltransferase